MAGGKSELPMIDYQRVSAFVGVSIAGVILLLVRRGHLHGPYVAWWLLVAAVVVVVGAFPEQFDKVALFLGVTYPPTLLLVLGMGLLLVKMLTMDLERSRQERKLRRLTQRLAMLEASLKEKPEVEQAQERRRPSSKIDSR